MKRKSDSKLKLLKNYSKDLSKLMTKYDKKGLDLDQQRTYLLMLVGTMSSMLKERKPKKRKK